MSKTKTPSRTQRWADAVSAAQDAVQEMIAARDRAVEAIGEIKAIQEEYADWRDNLPENLQQSALGEKLEAVCDLDLEPDENDIEAIETVVGEAEAAELPLGFGRD